MGAVILNSKKKMKQPKTMWQTQQCDIDHFKKRFFVNLDVCADLKRQLLPMNYSKSDDGLSSPWKEFVPSMSRTIWGLPFYNKLELVTGIYCNPPYYDIEPWAKKCYREWKENGVTSILLIPVNSCTKYWHEYCMKGQIFFFRRRISFINPHTGKKHRENPQSMALIVFSNVKFLTNSEYGSMDVHEIERQYGDRI